MSQKLELGQLCLHIPKAKLQLISQASLTASPQDASSTDFASALGERSAWVRRGQGLHLALVIRVAGKPLDCQQSRHIANSICNAELWKQLQLRATLPLPAPTVDAQDESNGIRINLSHLDVDASQEKSRHRLSSGASIADVKPPDGIEIVLLEQVKLSIDISPLSRRKVKRTKNHPSHYHVDNLDGTCSADFEDFTCGDIPGEGDFDLVSDDDSMIMDLPEECIVAGPSGTGESNRGGQTSKAVRVDSGISMDSQDVLQDLSSGTIASLVNIALYYSICEKSPKQKGGIKVKSDDMKMKLASIAPALWSPSFLKTMSERAPFVSTVAHTLSGSLLGNSRSPGLREKLAKLHHLHDSDSRHPSAANSALPNQITRYKSASVSMWKLLQRELYDPGATRRLWPLSTDLSNRAAASDHDDDDLLEEFWNDSQDVVTINEDEGYGFERMDESADATFLGIEDDEDDFDLLHEPDISHDVIVDSAYARFMPLQATFTSVEHETSLSGLLQDWSSDFEDFFDHEDPEDWLL